ncbi:MAG: hypothetical protein KME10_25775 [Plectolyngbya sp. WJT66-NPBG17]|nr:hypothetical protein [Plectolyngbya sp. WJT66-NPBG17]
MQDLTPSSNSHDSIERAIIQERLRQAHYSFNLTLIATGVSVCISLASAGLFLFGKLPESGVTALGGVASSACCIRFAKDANDRLDKMLKELDD